MQALHYYIKNQSQQLRSEIERISELLSALKDEKDHLDLDVYKDIKRELSNFNLRKQIELSNFNKQLIKKRFILNVAAEEERIQSDITKLKNLPQFKNPPIRQFSRVLVLNTEPKIGDIEDNDFIALHENGQLTIFWLEDGKIVNHSFGEMGVESIIQKLPAAGEESTDSDLIKQIKLQYYPHSKSTMITNLILSLEEHKNHFTSEGLAESIFDVAKKAVGLTGESWEAARGPVAALSQILDELGTAISGVFDSFTLIGETIVNFTSGIRAAEKYDIGTQLLQANNEARIEEIRAEHHLSEKKANKYKATDTAKRELLDTKNDLNLNRSVTGITNGIFGLIGTSACFSTIGIGIATLLEYLGVIALPATTLTSIGLAATGLSIVGPFILTTIFSNKLRQNYKEYEVQKKIKKEAKKEFTELRKEIGKPTYKELKNNYETSLHDPKKSLSGHIKFLNIYEKENAYRKEKQKLKSISVESIFSKIELASSLFAVAGVILLALTGVASFGVAPTVILVTGSAIALGAAAFEYVDKNNGHKYTDYISNKYKQFKSWILQDDSVENKVETKKNFQSQLKEDLKSSTASLLPDFKENKKSDLDRLDAIYDQLRGKEQKLFRHTAWDKIKTMTFTSLNEKLDFLLEARKHAVFNKSRGLGLFSTTSTVSEIDKSIADVGQEIRKATKNQVKTNHERHQHLYLAHR